MKNILLLAALLVGINFANASELKCPSDTTQLLHCEAVADSYVVSAVLCQDARGKLAIQLQLNDNSTTEFLSVKKVARVGATSYVGPDFTLVRGLRSSTLNMDGFDPIKLSCKR